MPRIDPDTLPEITDLFGRYRSQPEISFAQHVCSLEDEVTRFALDRVRVYLDRRYWIYLRDANDGVPQRRLHLDLLNALDKGIESGVLVCPITDAVFFELFRQGDQNRRMRTVKLIDRLSRGVVIKNASDRLHLEIVGFLNSMAIDRALPCRPCPNVWVRPYSFLGTPHLTGWPDPIEELAINKAFVTYMWGRTIEELLTDTEAPNDDGDQRFAASMTELSLKHQSEMRSFVRVYEAEARGFIDSAPREIGEAFDRQMRHMFPEAPHPTESQRTELERVSRNTLFNLIRLKKVGTGLPLIRIIAGLHAIIRWRKRPFSPNDYSDMYHAAAAIPYCNMFFTERFLKSVCTAPPLDFSAAFDTKIVSDEEEALELIERLA